MAADKKAAHLPLVYVCSPYAGDVKTNVKNAKRYSRFAVDENAIPVTPHLLYPQFMDDGNEAEREMAKKIFEDSELQEDSVIRKF